MGHKSTPLWIFKAQPTKNRDRTFQAHHPFHFFILHHWILQISKANCDSEALLHQQFSLCARRIAWNSGSNKCRKHTSWPRSEQCRRLVASDRKAEGICSFSSSFQLNFLWIIGVIRVPPREFEEFSAIIDLKSLIELVAFTWSCTCNRLYSLWTTSGVCY